MCEEQKETFDEVDGLDLMSKKIVLDPTLVAPWSDDLAKEEPYEYPFQASYQLEDKRLTYIASLHSCQTESNTFKMIRNVLETLSIEFIIVEGLSYSDGVSPAANIEWANKHGKNGFYAGFETAYAVSLASQKNIPFIGGEPNDQFILSQIISQGYCLEDLLYYYFVQQVFQSQESQAPLVDASNAIFNNFIQIKNKTFKCKTLPTFSDFQSWYLNKNGKKFAASEITAKVPAPYENGELFTQRISSSICKIRDQFIVKTIEEAINKYNSILIIYGGSHWSTQKKSLEDALGSPAFTAF